MSVLRASRTGGDKLLPAGWLIHQTKTGTVTGNPPYSIPPYSSPQRGGGADFTEHDTDARTAAVNRFRALLEVRQFQGTYRRLCAVDHRRHERDRDTSGRLVEEPPTCDGGAGGRARALGFSGKLPRDSGVRAADVTADSLIRDRDRTRTQGGRQLGRRRNCPAGPGRPSPSGDHRRDIRQQVGRTGQRRRRIRLSGGKLPQPH